MRDTYSARFLDRATPPHIITLILLAGVAGLAMNVFLPSLPNMALHFETEYWVLQMSVAAYFAMNAVLQILIGPVSDNLGTPPHYFMGLAAVHCRLHWLHLRPQRNRLFDVSHVPSHHRDGHGAKPRHHSRCGQR